MTDRRVAIIKSGMTGTGSDTRMYAPRSESSHMYRNNHEEDTYGMEDGEVRDKKYDKNLREREEAKEKKRKIKHIRINPKDLPKDGEDEENEGEGEDRDDSEKFDADRELHSLTGPPGNLGFETSLAMGGKGPGAAGGNLFAMSEKMDIIHQLLKMGKHGSRGVSATHRNFSPITPMGEVYVKPSKRQRMLNSKKSNSLGLQSTLTHAQRDEQERMEGMLDNFGNSLNVPKSELKRWGNWLPNSQTVKVRDSANQRRHVDNKGTKQGRNVRVSTGSPISRNLTPRQQDTMGVSNNMNLLQGLEHEKFMNTLGDMSNYEQAMKEPEEDPEPEPVVQQPAIKPRMNSEYEKLMNSILGADKNISTGEPMRITFQLLKENNKKREKQRLKEARVKWRPSTGQFETAPGGSLGPKGATGRRAKSQRRAVKRGKLTGMMDAPKAVEMEHRGVSVKQPMSKFPGKYKEYQGQQEARRRLGNVRSPTSSQRRFGQRSYTSGKTGGGKLLGGVGVLKPRIHSPRMTSANTAPHLMRQTTPSAGLSVGKMGLHSMGPPPMTAAAPPPPPRMPIQDPSQIQMSFDKVAVTNLLKATPSHADIVELRSLLRQMKRAMKTKDTTSKGMGAKDTSGSGEDKPKYNSASFRTTSRPEGATEDATNDSQAFGVHPQNRGGPTP